MRRWHLRLPNQRPTATHIPQAVGIPPPITFDSTTLANALVIRAAFLGVLFLALVIDGDVARVLLTNQHYLGDFTVFWTAARVDPSRVYDVEVMTQARYWLVQQPGVAPFVNPPSTLPLLKPFGGLPFNVALVCWIAVGLAGYLWAASRMLAAHHLPLLLVSPLLWISAATGQLSLLVGAAMIGGVAALPRRPVLAGVLFACAALLKPHVAALAPLGLIAGREWRALLSAAAAGGVAGLACVATQGIEIWMAWLDALDDFPALVESAGLLKSGVTPVSLPLPPWMRPAIAPAGAAIGAMFVWLAFSRTTDHAYRLISLVVGALLASPYGRKYDAVALQPAIILLLLHPRRNLFTVLAAGLGFVLMSRPLAVVGLAGMALSGRIPGLQLDPRRALVDEPEPRPA